MRIAPCLSAVLLLPALVQAAETPPATPAAFVPLNAAPMRQLTRENSATLQAGVGLAIEAGAGRILQLGRPAGSVFAADPRVVEVRPASPTSLFLFGVAPGRTTVAALDAQGNAVAQYEVTVRASGFGAAEAQSTLARLLPGQRIRAEARGNGIALLGEVATPADADQAVNIARGYLAEGQQLDNRLSVLGQIQVNLRVRIAEVSREVTRQLGIDWQALGTIGRFSLSLMTPQRHRRCGQSLQPAGRQRGQRRFQCQCDHRRAGAGPADHRAGRAEPDGDERRGRQLPGRRRIPHPGRRCATTS